MITGYEEIRAVNCKSWKSMGINSHSMTTEEFEKIVTKDKEINLEKIKNLIKNGIKEYIDDHNDTSRILEAVVILDNHYVCLVDLNSICCLNKLYVDSNEKIHLSRIL